jgi:hypothetical protein
LDFEGNPHISFTDTPNADARYAVKRGGSWFLETIGTAPGSYGSVLATSIALDSNGNPHIAYSGSCKEGGFLLYAFRSGHEWTVEIPFSPCGGWEYHGWWGVSLALDADANPHITFHDEERLKYVTKLGTWNLEVVEEPGGRFCSLALDDEGSPHISYRNGDVETKYATKLDGSWTYDIVDDDGPIGQTSLALDALGRAHISYYSGGTFALKYAVETDKGWIIQTVDASEEPACCRYVSLALDGQGNPHVSYFDEINGNLKYAVVGGAIGRWTIETVDSLGTVGEWSSLALDAQGTPHISYYDRTNGDLKYARRAAVTHVEETAFGSRVSLSAWPLPYTGAGALHISFTAPGLFGGAAPVVLSLCDVTGRVAVSLLNQELMAGPHTFAWSLKTSDRRYLATGVYYLRLDAGEVTETRKILILQ